MKRFRSIFLVFLTACGDPNTSLLDNLEVQPIVNPNVGILIDDDYLYMRFSENNNIIGITNNRTFNTSNDFQDFQVSEEITFLRNISFHGKPSINFVPDINHQSIFLYQERGRLTIYSMSNLENSEGIKIESIDTDLWAPDIESIEVFSDSNALLLESDVFNFSQANTTVYELDLDTGNYLEISKIENFRAIDFSFIDNLNGYMILTDDLRNYYYKGLYISKTLDGGHTWSEPLFLNDINSYFNLITPSENVVILHSKEFESEIIVSIDGGISWNNVQVGNSDIRDITFVSSNIGYAMDFTLNIYKTTNSGNSYSFVGKIPLPEDYGNCCFTDLIFYDESNGVAHSDDMAYRTYDGGKSWTPIIFPYDYVTID